MLISRPLENPRRVRHKDMAAPPIKLKATSNRGEQSIKPVAISAT